MTLRQARGVGLLLAIVLHILLVTVRIPSLLLFPGFLAHFFITGLHGVIGILDFVATTVEVIVNATLYATILYYAPRIARRFTRFG